jgi:pantoate--beta-alanine ligase
MATSSAVRVVETVREAQRRADAEREAGYRLAVVPTMGCLHEGHLSLVHEARRHADRVWVTIFVNPTQFGAGEDFARYPRTLEDDLERCRAVGVDTVFVPSVEEMYPSDARTWVDVAELTKPLCGADRPGHFRGVTTVVTKLFLATKPHVAVFGEKDFQQLAVIRCMVRDLGFDVEVVGAPIVREADGVAASSRNRLLDAGARRQARALSAALDAAERAVAAGERRRDALAHLVSMELGKAADAQVDYAELRDPEALTPSPAVLSGPALLALAVRFPAREGTVRLIDNRVLRPQSSVEDRPCS